MNSNRTRSNTPSALTAVDRARQTAAILRHDREQRAKRNRERLHQFATICAAVGVIVFFAIRLTGSV